MNIKTLFFGITADLIGASELDVVLASSISIGAFKTFLKEKYPQLKNINTYAIAVNEAYVEDELLLRENDVVAIIPPVSGG
jgi:molybdopterin converting factor subunit 1|tara:strand:+ start:34 stop:276 length:243 start_codon:yes stop_codon:yes gene_type:complete